MIDERYTAEYIAREANLLIQYCSPKNKRRGYGRNMRFAPNEMDRRIMQRWGLSN